MTLERTGVHAGPNANRIHDATQEFGIIDQFGERTPNEPLVLVRDGEFLTPAPDQLTASSGRPQSRRRK